MGDRSNSNARPAGAGKGGDAGLDRATLARLVQHGVVPRLLVACRGRDEARGEAGPADLIGGTALYKQPPGHAAPGHAALAASLPDGASGSDDASITASLLIARPTASGAAGTRKGPYDGHYAAGRELD